VTNPAIAELLSLPGRHPAFQELLRRLREVESGVGPQTIALCGLTPTAKALYLTLLWKVELRPIIVVVEDPKRAEALAETSRAFFEALFADREPPRPQLLPAMDVLPGHGLSPHAEICQQRALALWRLSVERVPITIAPVASALLRLQPPEFYRQLALRLRVGEEACLEDVVAHLESVGYQRRDPVEMVGEYAVRGGILDVFPPESGHPVRIEFFGDEIESMRRFDPETQRSVVRTDQCLLLPMVEQPRTPALLDQLREMLGLEGGEPPGWELLAPLVEPRASSLVEQVEKPIVVLDEPALLEAAAETVLEATPGGSAQRRAGAGADFPAVGGFLPKSRACARNRAARALGCRQAGCTRDHHAPGAQLPGKHSRCGCRGQEPGRDRPPRDLLRRHDG
jgi:transcription-repair coupling factor (superfamily II helicase)